MTVRVLAQKDGTTAEDHRLGLAVMMAGAGAAALDRRSGIVPYVGSCDLTAVSAMVGRISPFTAYVDGTSNSLQGAYPVVVDANTDLTFANGEAGNTRIDRVCLQIRDNPYDASGFQDGQVVIIKGQAGGAANAIPASSLLLWEVLVPTGATVGNGGITFASARTDKRTYCSALGGLIPVATSTERDLMTPYEGLQVWRVDAKSRQAYTGGAWRWMDLVVCSSAANRDALVPAGIRYTGQQIYRSDTGLYETWDGTVWAVVPATRIVRKNVSTPRTATTVSVDDVGTTGGNALTLPVAANGTYEVEFWLLVEGSATGDFKCQWNVPAGSSGAKGVIGPTSTAASFTSRTDTRMRAATHGFATSVSYSMDSAGNGECIVEKGILIVGATPGNVTLQWSQATSDPTATIVYDSSYLKVTRIS